MTWVFSRVKIQNSFRTVSEIFPQKIVENHVQSLSRHDLFDAREAFHLHLMNKENVVATALGKYRRRLKPGNEAKTLTNTQITPDSWPCILVFVDHWVTFDEFRKRTTSFDSYIPSSVYLPDSRQIPICVIEDADASFGQRKKLII